MARKPASASSQRFVNNVSKYTVLSLFALIAIYPIISMWLTALRKSNDILRNPFGLPTRLATQHGFGTDRIRRFSGSASGKVVDAMPEKASVGVTSMFLGVAGVATFVPAHRATSIDPTTALRVE